MSVIIETGFTGNIYPLDHGRVCWERVTGTVSASSELAGFEAINALPPRTDSAWRPTAVPSNWDIIFDDPTDVSFIGIAKHEFGSKIVTFSLQWYDGSVWTTFAGASGIRVDDDSPILFLCETRSVRGIRLLITSIASMPRIAIISVGVADEWPRPFTWTGRPITEGQRIAFENVASVTGNWLGRTARSEGLQFSLTMDHASEAWRQSDLKAFKDHANGGDAVFFIAARPGDYPDEVAFSWSAEVVYGERSLVNKAISTSITLNCQGLVTSG